MPVICVFVAKYPSLKAVYVVFEWVDVYPKRVL